jgi:hypothetical protein
MTPDELFQRHPSLFRILKNNVSIGPGWLALLDELAARLDRLSARLPLTRRPAFTNITQRHGLLRVSLDTASPAMWSCIEDAEDESSQVCEHCGAPGETEDIRGWVTTLCGGCSRSLRKTLRRVRR